LKGKRRDGGRPRRSGREERGEVGCMERVVGVGKGRSEERGDNKVIVVLVVLLLLYVGSEQGSGIHCQA